jgi:hypothetical protein
MVGAILRRNHLQFTLQQVVVDVEGSPLIVKVGLWQNIGLVLRFIQTIRKNGAP